MLISALHYQKPERMRMIQSDDGFQSTYYLIVLRALRTRDLVKTMTGSGRSFSLIGTILMAFGEWNSKPRHTPTDADYS